MEGEGGCDYTIGCNTRIETVEASCIEDAKALILKYLDSQFSDENDPRSGCSVMCNEYRVNEISVYEIARSDNIDLKYFASLYENKQAQEEVEKEEAEILKRAAEITARNKIQ